MEQKYTDIADYFTKLAEKHSSIKDFCRNELDELLDRTLIVKGFPVLVLEGFDFDYSGSMPDNVLKSQNGAFCIVDACDTNNAKVRTETLERAEKIAEQILMKMVKDKRERLPLLTSFEIASAEGRHFVNPMLGCVFCRISFSFRTKIEEIPDIWQ